jgi:DNA-binding GntR family transcriptional regulator
MSDATSRRATDGRAGDRVAIAHGRLKDAILHLRLARGAQCAQQALGREAGVGRTPLREALRELEVTALDAGDAEQLYMLLATLEPPAVRATLRRTAVIHAPRAPAPAAADHRAVRAFHHRLTHAAGTRAVATILRLVDQAYRYERAAAPADDVAGLASPALLAALADRDADRAAALIAHHHLATGRAVVAALDPGRATDGLDLLERVLRPRRRP